VNDFDGGGVGVGVGVGLGVGLGVGFGVALGVGFGVGVGRAVDVAGGEDAVAERLGAGALEVCCAAGDGDDGDERASEGAGDAATCFFVFLAWWVARRVGDTDTEGCPPGTSEGATSPPSVTVPATWAAVGDARSTTSGPAGEYDRTATTPTTVPADTNSARFMAPQTVANDS
jgi:hypothetical protein